MLAVAIARGIVQSARAARGRAAEDPGLALVVALFGLALLNQARVRTDALHLMPAALMAILSLPYVLLPLPPRDDRPRRAAAIAGLALYALLAAGLLLEPAMKQRDALRALSLADLPAGPPHADRDATVEFVRETTSPSEAIYVGVPRHDRIFGNDALLYFLAGRRSATRYHELHPGIATTRAVQLEIVSELEASRTRVVVIHHGLASAVEPNRSREASGVTVLDDYLRDHFETVRRIGPYEVRVRRPADASEANGRGGVGQADRRSVDSSASVPTA